MKTMFKLEENGTTLSTEIRAGLTSFMAMAYIIFLNPIFLSDTGMNASGVLAATCLSAALGTALSAFFSNKPFAYSITAGIAVGFISYLICKLAARKYQELNIPTVVICLIFILYFCYNH